MISRFFPANSNVSVQRVVHYQGRRPFRAFIIAMLGYLVGYYASGQDCRLPSPRPTAVLWLSAIPEPPK